MVVEEPPAPKKRGQKPPSTPVVEEPEPPVEAQESTSQADDAPYDGVVTRGVSQELAAALIDVSPTMVSRWVKVGAMRRTTEGLIPIFEVRRKLIEVSKRRNSTADQKGEPDLADATRRKTMAQAEAEEFKLAQLKGALVSRAAVAAAFKDIATTVKSRMLGLADVLSGQVAAETDEDTVRRMILAEVHDLLSSFGQEFKALKSRKEVDNGTETRRAGGSGGEAGESDA